MLLVSLLKWPVALTVAALTPAAALSSWHLALEAFRGGMLVSPFALGFGAAVVFLFLFHRLRFFRLWATIDHELTHALFAWLTLVDVHEISANDGSQAVGGRLGHVRLGGSNWLITISPYFFPTASVALLLLTWILAAQPTLLAGVLMGMATGWSVVSTWHETHIGQTDLKEVGFLFSLLFLPGANLLCYGMLIANELGGFPRTVQFVASAVEITRAWLGAAGM